MVVGGRFEGVRVRGRSEGGGSGRRMGVRVRGRSEGGGSGRRMGVRVRGRSEGGGSGRRMGVRVRGRSEGGGSERRITHVTLSNPASWQLHRFRPLDISSTLQRSHQTGAFFLLP